MFALEHHTTAWTSWTLQSGASHPSARSSQTRFSWAPTAPQKIPDLKVASWGQLTVTDWLLKCQRSCHKSCEFGMGPGTNLHAVDVHHYKTCETKNSQWLPATGWCPFGGKSATEEASQCICNISINLYISIAF